MVRSHYKRKNHHRSYAQNQPDQNHTEERSSTLPFPQEMAPPLFMALAMLPMRWLPPKNTRHCAAPNSDPDPHSSSSTITCLEGDEKALPSKQIVKRGNIHFFKDIDPKEQNQSSNPNVVHLVLKLR